MATTEDVHRLSFSDEEIRFVLYLLEDQLENIVAVKGMMANARRKYRDKIERLTDPEYLHYTDVYTEMVRKQSAVKDLIHRFEATLRGGKPRTDKYARMSMQFLLAEAEEKRQKQAE